MQEEKKIKIQNLKILTPSFVENAGIYSPKIGTKEREIIKLKQNNSLINIGTYNMDNYFDTIDNEKIDIFNKDNIYFNNPYVGVFNGDNINMLSYLWNMKIYSQVELCKYQVSLQRDYTKEELKYILELIREEQRYKNCKTKKYIFINNKTNNN